MQTIAENHPKLRVVFAGTPDFAARHLQALIDAGDYLIVGVYTQPDRPSGRGKKLTASPVKQLAETAGLPVFQPHSLKSGDARAGLSALDPDIMVVVAYGLILPREVLDIPRCGCINVHASILPRWRGAAPIQRAIQAGDRESGITIMQMDPGLDTGDILKTVRCPIAGDETAGSLQDKLAEIGAPALLQTLEDIAQNRVQPSPQDDTRACYAAKISKDEAEIDWSVSAVQLDRDIRAFNPFPAAYTVLEGERIRIWRAAVVKEGTGTAPGTVTEINETGVVVGCGQGALRLLELQLPGKKRLPVADILRGHPNLLRAGTRLGKIELKP